MLQFAAKMFSSWVKSQNSLVFVEIFIHIDFVSSVVLSSNNYSSASEETSGQIQPAIL